MTLRLSSYENADKLVLTEDGLDRRYYELCALSELKNALRSDDIWVEGSRQFKNFNEYLLPASKFTALQQARHRCRTSRSPNSYLKWTDGPASPDTPLTLRRVMLPGTELLC
jgi:hypothetical protein